MTARKLLKKFKFFSFGFCQICFFLGLTALASFASQQELGWRTDWRFKKQIHSVSMNNKPIAYLFFSLFLVNRDVPIFK